MEIGARGPAQGPTEQERQPLVSGMETGAREPATEQERHPTVSGEENQTGLDDGPV